MGSQSNQNISIRTGDSSNAVGVVYGDVNYYSYYGSPKSGDDHVDLDWYRASIKAKFGEWKSKYTLLDANPVLSVIGNDLKPIEGVERTLTEAIIRSHRLVVFGGAGAGKTTSLRFFAYSITSEPTSLPLAKDEIPDACLLVDLTRFRTQQDLTPLQSILVLIGEILHATPQADPPSLIAIHHFLASQARLILLFDGLNEVPLEGRSSFLKGLADLGERYPVHKYVLTTRPHRFRAIEGWEMVALRDLRAGQIREFLTRYTDRDTAQSIAKSVQGNPLTRVPLFLSYIVAIARAGAPVGTTVNSKSAVVGSYVEILLNRDAPESVRMTYFEDIAVLRSALISLAQRSNLVGLSTPFRDAVALLAEHERVDQKTATTIIEQLLARTLMVRDGQYVRFWHQTIQEHFYAAGVVKAWRGDKEELAGSARTIRRVLIAAEEQGALLHVPYFLNDRELRVATPRCVRWNPGLAISWLEDLYFEKRCSDVIIDATGVLRRRALAARRYSRVLPGDWRRYAYSLLSLVIILLFAFGMLDGPIILQVTFVAPVVLLWGLLVVDILRSPGARTLDQILLAAFRVRNVDLRRALATIADEVSRSRLTGSAQRALATSIAKSGVDDNAFSLVRNSPSRIAAIRVLGRVPDEFAVSILEFCLRYNNVFSEAALEGLAERAARFPQERQQIAKLATRLYTDPGSEWRFVKRAKKCILASGVKYLPPISRRVWFNRPTRRGLQLRILSSLVAFICSLALYAGLGLVVAMADNASRAPYMHVRTDETRNGTLRTLTSEDLERGRAEYSRFRKRMMLMNSFLLVFVVSIGAFLYRSVKKASKGGAEGAHPWAWAFSAMIFYISVPAFYFYRDQMRKNAVPFDLEALQDYLAEDR